MLSKNSRLSLLLGTTLSIGLSACNAPDAGTGIRLGQDEVTGTSQPIPTVLPDPSPTTSPDPVPPPNPSPSPSPTVTPTSRISASCHTSDPSHICLSLKYVVYEDSQGTPVVSQDEALSNLTQINTIWSQCNIGFEIDEYLPENPADYGLNFNTSTSSELTRVRSSFVDSTNLLVVTTGAWAGTLGAGSANAWTTMPGGGVYGVVLEQPVGTYPNIIAHELGHYLNLDHVSDTSDVMSPVIYTTSTMLTSSQCSSARAAAQYYWPAMDR